MDLQPRLQRILRFGEPELGLAAAEQFGEELLEVGGDLLEGGDEALRFFTEPKNGLLGFSSSLKLPWRISAVGTVTLTVCTWKKLTHSCAPKKNNRSLNIWPGTGLPNEYPYCL